MDDRAQMRRDWLEGHLRWAAEQFGVHPVGDIVHTSRYHSVGTRVRTWDGDAWLRVVYDDPEWGVGDYLEGNVAANEIAGVPSRSASTIPCLNIFMVIASVLSDRSIRNDNEVFANRVPLIEPYYPARLCGAITATSHG